MAADGSVVFSVDLDDKDAQKELNKLVKKSTRLTIKFTRNSKTKCRWQSSRQKSRQISMRQKRRLIQCTAAKSFYGGFHQGPGKHCEIFAKEYDAVTAKVEKMDASIQSDTANLDKMKTKAGELSEKSPAQKRCFRDG